MAAPHLFRMDDAVALKAALRGTALALRANGDPGRAGAALAEHVRALSPPPSGAVIAGFWPMGSEIDIRPLLHALSANGHTLALPVTPRRGAALAFRRWRPGDALVPGPLGTSQPRDGVAVLPDWLLVPLLAFDRAGNRLGYGGGYYDRTLAALPGAVAIGCAYAAQEVPSVPTGPHDVRLNAIATECGIVAVGA